MQKVQASKDENYKNYRANFLIFWILINWIVGGTIVALSRSGNETIIFYISIGLSVIIGFKIILAIVHSVVSCFHNWETRRLMETKTSEVFTDFRNGNVDEDAEVFGRFQIMTPAEKAQYMKELEKKDALERKTNMLIQALSGHVAGKVKNKARNVKIQGIDASSAFKRLQSSANGSNIFGLAFKTNTEINRVGGNSCKLIYFDLV